MHGDEEGKEEEEEGKENVPAECTTTMVLAHHEATFSTNRSLKSSVRLVRSKLSEA
jgi:hypothetical protein